MGDYSRFLFDEKSFYSGVRAQQGRVQLDSDWNEQLAIDQHRTFSESIDVIGKSGAPKKNAGFKISLTANGTDLNISPGRMYVNGLMCDLFPDNPATYKRQPFFPGPDLSNFSLSSSPPGSPPNSTIIKDGSYIVYLKAWQREVTYLDDPLIQEKALGEADTTTRLQTVWQVRLLRVNDSGSGSCSTSFSEWNNLISPRTGKLNAKSPQAASSQDACVLPPSAGYMRLENQLYRVEVQKTDSAMKALSFKWSRDNACIETGIDSVSGNELIVNEIGKDEVMSFGGQQWVEIIDEAATFNGTPNQLVQIDYIRPDTRKIVLTTSVQQFAGKPNLKLRRWDLSGASATQDGVIITPGWMPIEDGIQVNFNNGTYEPGDYWLIPARTATGAIEWPEIAPGAPIEQPRAGTEYNYAKLAFLRVKQGSVELLEDCRDIFPSLTDIWADDVYFNNNNCKFPNSTTNVQEALDILCAANDLRDHNKHLHGVGVVCGLKLTCGTDRNRLFVENGYALDCDGNIIRNQTRINFNVMAAVANMNVLDTNGDGLVCLSIEYNGANQPIITLDPFIKQTFWEEVLEGTLLKDFFEKTLLSLIVSLKSELSPLTETVPVPVQQRRVTALFNLLYGLLNPASGQYSLITGTLKPKRDHDTCGKGKVEDKEDDELLYCFFEKLKSLLASDTYCAEFDHDVYPAYEIDEGLTTIYGTPFKQHQRMRIGPKEKTGFTCKGDSKIYVYDLGTEELIKILEFPDSRVVVQDVVLSTDEKTLYVVGLLNGTESLFAAATGALWSTWTGPFTVPGTVFMTLGMDRVTNKLYGIAKGVGLFEVKITNTVVTTSIAAFNATGLMAIAPDERSVYAAEYNASTAQSDIFDRIRKITFAGANSSSTTFNDFNGVDSQNDLVASDRGYFLVTGHTTGSTSPNVWLFYCNSNTKLYDSLDLGEPQTLVRLAVINYNPNYQIYVSLADQAKVIYVEGRGGKLKQRQKFRIPVRAFATSMVASQKRLYVLSYLFNVITVVDLDRALMMPDYSADPPDFIADYREASLKAYKGLLNNLLQYIKDGFFERFIIDCPDCDTAKDKVYLGTIDIRGSKIYHICNFTKRKYVKTFRTVDYWKSAIPIQAVFRKMFNTIACSVFK